MAATTGSAAVAMGSGALLGATSAGVEFGIDSAFGNDMSGRSIEIEMAAGAVGGLAGVGAASAVKSFANVPGQAVGYALGTDVAAETIGATGGAAIGTAVGNGAGAPTAPVVDAAGVQPPCCIEVIFGSDEDPR